ncbi:sporulation integral membrane protein YlbJ [Anoxybacillus vitaminiphilus]|uniref:Sporulation integral membrane protein YlbJ n=1 Tax=Paranoxybacillus vitaminiphilus TaxID=581036 RepID=A0A327YQL4_9BACL|nr:sporulation integral membrane protein YlbJ [Anoxybacillus vitaminiphilus]RAK23253.1 sporulation integral membrane protein YlbJ [Anoxybacillus vitaminiphilus]
MKERIKTIFLALSVTLFAVSLICYPKQSFEASINGLNMWWKVVFPSLLPFFIVSELLIHFGVVNLIGVLLEPLMRPLFKVPGVGGFVWAMGMASGYPAGAKLTARLRQEKQISAIEAERLVSFTNSSNPLFIFGAVSVGFFHNPQIGVVLALSHYIGNICVGLLMRFHGKANPSSAHDDYKRKVSIREAFRVLHRTRLKNEQAIGKMLGDAVRSSIQTLLMIGGFIILFSVLNKLLYMIHITDRLANIFQYLLSIFALPKELSIPLISGLFEITLGSQMTSQTDNVGLLQKTIITSFILAFSGFSVQAQVASILAETDIRFQPFFIARVFHGIFAAVFTYVFWKPFYEDLQAHQEHSKIIPVFLTKHSPEWLSNYWQLLSEYGPMITLLSLAFYVLLLALDWRKEIAQ